MIGGFDAYFTNRKPPVNVEMMPFKCGQNLVKEKV